MAKVKLKVEKRNDGWWVTDLPYGFDDQGHYETKAEAEEARVGLQRYFEDNHKWLEKHYGTSA